MPQSAQAPHPAEKRNKIVSPAEAAQAIRDGDTAGDPRKLTLAVTGLTHWQSYKDIFAMTVIKTSAVFVLIALYYLTGLV